MHSSRTRRWAALAATVSTVLGLQVAIQVVRATPAAAVPSLDLFVSPVVGPDSSPQKSARALCPAGEQVVGGGGWADDGGARTVMLTELRPADGVPGATPDSYWVFAQEPSTGFDRNWSLTAYAMCAAAHPESNYRILRGAVAVAPAQTFAAATSTACPNGQQVVGTGAGIRNIAVTGRVGLQLSRPSGPLDISRATARETGSGYDGNWELHSWAICRNAADLVVEGTLSGTGTGTYTCSNPQHEVHSVGGGGSLTDSGPVWLQGLYPVTGLRTVRVVMTGPPAGGMAVQAICGR